jgi:mannose-6-phosphate isomerase-like protein (cupin superfamily)
MDMLPVDSRRPERIRTGRDEITVLAASAQTGGALFAMQVRMPPGGGPPVMHRHDHGEVYLVQRGEFTFYIGGADDPDRRRVSARAGEVVPLAGRTPHTIRNESTEEAVAFVVHAPGAPRWRRRTGSSCSAPSREPSPAAGPAPAHPERERAGRRCGGAARPSGVRRTIRRSPSSRSALRTTSALAPGIRSSESA